MDVAFAMRRHGFVHVLDPWSAPVAAGRTALGAAETVVAGLRKALGAPLLRSFMALGEEPCPASP